MARGVLILLLIAMTGCSRAAETESLARRAGENPSFDNLTAYGLELSRANRHEEALEQFKHSAAISPDSPLAENNVCAELNALGRGSEAAPHCEKALRMEPEFALAKSNLEFARRAPAQVHAPASSDAELVEKGLQLYRAGSYDPAIGIWQQIQPTSSQYSVSQSNIASAAILLQRYDLARAAIDRALKIDPGNALFKRNERWLNQVTAAKNP